MKIKLWEPNKNDIKDSHLNGFITHINEAYSLDLNTFADIHEWSVTEVESFWKEAANYLNIKFNTPPTTIVKNPKKMPGISNPVLMKMETNF